MTDRLYYRDSFLYNFDAEVRSVLENPRPALILDRTAFYPTSGGQIHDTGWIFPTGSNASGPEASDKFRITEVVDTLEEDPADFDRILSTNLRGPWMIAREAARRMVAAKIPGSIVNVASILALRQAGRVTAYATAKAGLVQMTKQLALEWARYRIRVNALAPGYVETDFNRDFFQAEKGQEMIRRIPSRRLTPMQDLAEPLILLAGDGGASITGVVLPVDAGHLLSSL